MHPDLPVILAIDQGTSSTKALAVNERGEVVARGSAPVELATPRPGWVEHDPVALIASVSAAIDGLAGMADISRCRAIGISNQRESMLLWDRATGQALSPVLSWQDRRTTDLCQRFRGAGIADDVRRISGLPLDPMFSAVKAVWLLDAYDPGRVRSTAGDLCLGTVDSWITWHLTGVHSIEAGNASRTSLVDLATGQWSQVLLDAFGIPMAVLPPIVASTHDHGVCLPFAALPEGIRLTGVLADSHAALFAHRGWQPGVAKATFGTGSSVMAAIHGSGTGASMGGLCRTVAWRLEGHQPTLAVEANILSSGATLAWLAGVLGTSASDLADHAAAHSGGVQLVPAFNGLGAPWWDGSAQAVIVGMSLATTTADLARAALDSIVLQVSDVFDEMAAGGLRPARVVVDGGASANRDLMRRLADLLDMPVLVSDVSELSAMGAAWAAGVGAGLWSLADLDAMPRAHSHMTPGLSGIDVDALRSGWQDALSRSRALAPGTTREDSHHG